VDFSELPQSSRDLIDAAELAAQSVFDAFQGDKDSLTAQAEEMGTSLSSIAFAPGNMALKVAAAKDTQGRHAAADLLFRVTTGEYWKLLRPDVEAFMSKTTDVWRWAYQKFQINAEIPATVKRAWRIWALQARAAAAGRLPRPPLSNTVPAEIPALQGMAKGAMRGAKRKPKSSKRPFSSRPHLPLNVHESVAEIEERTRRLLKGCRNIAPNGHRLSFNVEKATEILRTCAADAFDKQAEYLTSRAAFDPQWLSEVASQTLSATLDTIDPLDLLWDSVPEMPAALWGTLTASLEKWNRNPPLKQTVKSSGKSENNTDRRAAVDSYIEEVRKAGQRITRTTIWKFAGYKSRTEFERWERNDLDHPNKAADGRFTRILTERPHLK
jgi:hypothetical protein